MIFYCLLVQ